MHRELNQQLSKLNYTITNSFNYLQQRDHSKNIHPLRLRQKKEFLILINTFTNDIIIQQINNEIEIHQLKTEIKQLKNEINNQPTTNQLMNKKQTTD